MSNHCFIRVSNKEVYELIAYLSGLNIMCNLVDIGLPGGASTCLVSAQIDPAQELVLRLKFKVWCFRFNQCNQE